MFLHDVPAIAAAPAADRNRAIVQGVPRAADGDGETAITILTALPGIGRWSADIYLVCCLKRPDTWPVGNLGIALGVQYLLDLSDRLRLADVAWFGERWRRRRSGAACVESLFVRGDRPPSGTEGRGDGFTSVIARPR